MTAGRRSLLWVPALLILLLMPTLMATQDARAAVLVVTRTDDPNPNGCAPTDCSLREAVIASNNRPGPDVIRLKAEDYVLARAGLNENQAQTGDLDIRKPVTIDGRGRGLTSIDGNALDRVFHILGGVEDVVISDLQITGGQLNAATFETAGGGILNRGQLNLQRVSLKDNEIIGCCGGGISNLSALNIGNSVINGNTVSTCCGGGISNSGGDVTIRNSRIHHNVTTTSCCGAGLSNEAGGTVKIVGSRFDHNDVDDCCGGALYNQHEDSFVSITRTRFEENSVGNCCGGAIANYKMGRMLISRSSVSNNDSALCCGGGVYNDIGSMITLRLTDVIGNEVNGCCGGGLYNQNSTMRLENSAIRNNQVDASATGGGGGGIYTYSGGRLVIVGTLVKANDAIGATGTGGGLEIDQTSNPKTTTIKNSTFVLNSTAVSGGGIFKEGVGTLSVLNSTFSENSAITDGGGIYEGGSERTVLRHVTITRNQALGDGGGIWWNGKPFDVLRSIVASNSPEDCSDPLTGGTGVNLDKDSTCFTIGNPIHASPRLRPLANNGGPTPTHALRQSSPAVDAVPRSACPPPGRDQRGVKRPQDGDGNGSSRCDLGAFERKD